MPETQAKIGYGTLLQRETTEASPATFQTIAEVRKIGAFGSKRGLLDATNMLSPGGFMEYVLNLKDGVELNVEANFLPSDPTQSSTDGLIADHNSGTRRSYRIVLPENLGTFTFSGLVMAWSCVIDVNAVLVGTFSIKVTGEIGFEAGA